MNKTEFAQQYTALLKKALPLAEKARRQGLLSLACDPEKVKERDIFEYGLNFAIDGTDPYFIEKILSNIIAQEKDEYTRIYKTIQKEAVFGIQQGLNPRMLHNILNSLTDIPLKDDDATSYINSEKTKKYDAEFEEANKELLLAMGIKPKSEANKNQPFAFNDFIRFDDRYVQYILRNTDPHDLAVALKTASLAVQGKFFKNMSHNAAVMLKEEMEYMGQMSEEYAQEAQQRIIAIIDPDELQYEHEEGRYDGET